MSAGTRPYNLTAPDRRGKALVNMNIGPPDAETFCDRLTMLYPHALLVIGHCAGLRTSQQPGDNVLEAVLNGRPP